MFSIKYPAGRSWLNPTISTDWKWLIRAYQGNRRVSSRVAPGTQAYFDTVTNSLSGWWTTWLYQRKWKFEYVVVMPDGAEHGAAYVKALQEKEAAQKYKILQVDIEHRLQSLQSQRLLAREAKNYALADALRAEIEAAGIVVNDRAIKKVIS